MDYILDIITDRGIPFRVVYGIRINTYGMPIGAIPVVSFYDRRYPHSDYGQFVSDYDIDTLLQREDWALNLDGGVPNWYIDRASMVLVTDWLVMLRSA